MRPTKDIIQKERKRLLGKVARHIVKQPKTLNMHRWLRRVRKDKAHPCGTVGCIAGWTVVLGEKDSLLFPAAKHLDEYAEARVNDEEVATVAGRQLGLKYAERQSLFYTSGWPEPFKTQYWEATGHLKFDIDNGYKASPAVALKIAKITAARIRHFIKTGE